MARDRRRKENMDGIRRLTGGEYELGDDAADDENTDDDEADDGEDTDDDEAGDDEAADEDEADDDETAGGDGDKTDEEPPRSQVAGKVMELMRVKFVRSQLCICICYLVPIV